MELLTAKGVRDFAPQDKIARQQVVDLLRTTFELYGFSPLETPIIERLDVLSAKYAGGAEILKETFRFKDQGERDLCLRYDLTVPLARFVGMNPSLKMPFKRYAIGHVFRDGPIKLGRYREFMQCDADIVGASSMLADALCVKMAQSVFERLGLDVVIEVNNRKLLDGILDSLEIPDSKKVEVILEIDKLKKTSLQDVKKELKSKGIDNDAVERLMKILATKGSNITKLEALKTLVNNRTAADGLKEIEQLLSFVDERNVVFSLCLSRGLAYYTGPVFEVFLSDQSKFTSSLAGGGRYDKMIGSYLRGTKEFPAVGISFGIEPILTVLELQRAEKEPKNTQRKTVTEVFVVPIRTTAACLKICDQLRNADIKCDLDIMERGVSKNLEYANALGIPYCLIVGENELKSKQVKFKDMESGNEELLSVDAVIKKLKLL
ncbi:histidine--tRNA ligase [Candidatus Woesearchaeota archaeon]|nr:histidine--tRNA ligase [Candidatus Woesearchaeota archaeon]